MALPDLRDPPLGLLAVGDDLPLQFRSLRGKALLGLPELALALGDYGRAERGSAAFQQLLGLALGAQQLLDLGAGVGADVREDGLLGLRVHVLGMRRGLVRKIR